ncbi:MAG: NusG domain II-containing protein [Eubacteriales bacterium]|nr:NusG domain II-containing protein [Eubacteriales bacterium]
MTDKTRFPLRRGDFFLFFIIIAAACGIWIRLAMLQADQCYGEIWLDGELYQQVKLGDTVEQQTIRLQGKATEVVIEIEGTRMRFVESQCPDHTCEQTGWISRVGQTAVCLPNRVMIQMTGGDTEDAVDAVVR